LLEQKGKNQRKKEVDGDIWGNQLAVEKKLTIFH